MIKELTKLRESELGFTLIEVMVVIIMVGILAAIAVPLYTNYVYRARAAEGVSTLGAIKTFALERRSATGYWPDSTALNDEFRDFKNLYYFSFDKATYDSALDPNAGTLTIRLLPTSNFDAPSDIDHLELKIDWDTPENSGWSGDIKDKYANHLPGSK